MTRPLVALAALLALGGCAGGPSHAPEPDPVPVVEAWHQALVEARPKDAWALLHPEARGGMTEARFLQVYERDKAALVEQAQRLLDLARSRPATQSARVRVGERGEAQLERTAEGWRIVSPIERPPEHPPEGESSAAPTAPKAPQAPEKAQ